MKIHVLRIHFLFNTFHFCLIRAGVYPSGHQPRGRKTRWTGSTGHSLTPRGRFQLACNSTVGEPHQGNQCKLLEPRNWLCVVFICSFSFFWPFRHAQCSEDRFCNGSHVNKVGLDYMRFLFKSLLLASWLLICTGLNAASLPLSAGIWNQSLCQWQRPNQQASVIN